MAQAEGRVRSRVSPCGICGGQSGIATGPPPPPGTSVFPCPFHSTGAPLQEQIKKNVYTYWVESTALCSNQLKFRCGIFNVTTSEYLAK
jgi:hypothetical protein